MPREFMPLDILKAFAESARQSVPCIGSTQSPQPNLNGSVRLRVADWLRASGIPFRIKEAPTADGRTVYLLPECPFDPEHGKRGEVAIMQERSGRTSFKCHHNSCAGRGWQDVKQVIRKPTQDHYDGIPSPTVGTRVEHRKEVTPASILQSVEPGAKVTTADGRTGTVLRDNRESSVVQVFDGEGGPSEVCIPKAQLQGLDGQPLAPTGFSLNLMDSSEFASADFRQHYLVKRTLVQCQPCIIGGPKKAMKTGMLVDLAVSLGTGTPFLSHPEFIVPDQVRTCVLSGESGGYTLRETAKRVCLARNRLLNSADILWGFELPQLANPEHLDGIEKTVRERGIKVLIFDPAYLCLLAGTSGINPGDVFAMGAILKQIGELGDRTGCTIIIAHHTRKKDRKERYQPTDLEDLAMSGFAEWARQWLLLGRRAEYEADGKHDLWLNIGGSAGHSGCYVLSIDEGVADDEGAGRKWQTWVSSARERIERDREASKKRKAEAVEDQQQLKLESLLAVIRKNPDGETKSRLRTLTKPRPSADEFDVLVEDLIQRTAIETCSIKKNGRSLPTKNTVDSGRQTVGNADRR